MSKSLKASHRSVKESASAAKPHTPRRLTCRPIRTERNYDVLNEITGAFRLLTLHGGHGSRAHSWIMQPSINAPDPASLH